MVLRHGKFQQFYCCSRSPLCDLRISCHPGTDDPVGIPADGVTRRWRRIAHFYFDRTWRGPKAYMSRNQAYDALCKTMKLPPEQAHIGRFTKGQCRELVRVLLGPGGFSHTNLTDEELLLDAQLFDGVKP
ncbi:MAG: DUF3268 family zinc-finger domain-containing protein [Deltaproteobacteria bacterium]|nr:DUF3268 family zinc-finger domain-containing protein [Deltaproteobacteria bacterium]